MPDSLRHNAAYFAILLSIGSVVLDASAATFALPRIAADLGLSASQAVWIVNAYQIAIVALLLPVSALAESFGYRRVYLSGLAAFLLGAVVTTMATDAVLLIAVRLGQGVASAAIMGVNIALLRQVASPEDLPRALGLNATVIALTTTAAAPVAGALLVLGSWHWVYLACLVTGVPALLLGWRRLPAHTGSGRRPPALDALLSMVAFAPLLLAACLFSQGHPAGLTALPAVIGTLALAVLTWRSLAANAPVLPVDLLARRDFSLAISTSFIVFVLQMLTFVSLPFFLWNTLQLAPQTAGLVFAVWPLSIAAVAAASGRFFVDAPLSLVTAGGLTILAGGLVLLALLDAGHGLWPLVVAMMLGGAGFGLFQTSNNRALIASTPIARSGAVGGAASTARLLGQGLGAAAASGFLAAGSTGAAFAAAAILAGAGLALCLLRWVMLRQ